MSKGNAHKTKEPRQGQRGSPADKVPSDNFFKQVNVLKVLARAPSTEPKQFQISEISELSGVRDEREIQRHLFILEGQKLVSPFPAGDFTSKLWHITRDGLRAVRKATAVIERTA